MGRWRSTALPGRTDGGRVLEDVDLEAALGVCAQDPVAAVLATTRIEAAARLGLRLCGGQLWGFQRDGVLVAVCWAGANLVPVIPDGGEDAIEAFAELAQRAGRQCSSIVGDSEAVLGVWERLAGTWSRPRDVRADQPSMVIDQEPRIVPDPYVRRSRREEYELVLPACVRMFQEEVGYSPTSGQGSGPYESRVRSLIAEGRSFVRIEDAPPGSDGPAREVVFKAELGAIAGGVAQVQGVWVVPHQRGLGLSESGMAAVVQATLRHVAPVVSLYANSYNVRALAAYRAVGFRQVGTYATILF